MTDADDPTHEMSSAPGDDPTDRLEATTPLPAAGSDSTPTSPDVDPDRVDQAEALRFMARRLLIWAVPLLLLGILSVALGLPVWLIVIALLVALAVAVFEIDL
jgi:hypothetical protein